MTGQVDGISLQVRELGFAREGCIVFCLIFAKRHFREKSCFEFVGLNGKPGALELQSKALAFTYCQVPVVYRLSADPRIRVIHGDETVSEIPGLALDRETSASVFGRTGAVSRLEVFLTPGC
jgi:hypothetical protein